MQRGAAGLPVEESIGVALPSPESRTPVDLLRDADAAMYRAKAAGRARHEVFDASLRARALERVRSEAALRRAVEREELVLHYQPIVGMAGGAVDGVEALVRWQRPGVGLVPPGDFVPLAEASGLIVDLGAWVVREACRQLAQWNASRPDDPPLCISINLSARQVQDDGLPAVVADAIAEWGLDPDQLQLEITETVLVEDTPATARRVRALLDLGVRLVLDDFGRGYSSLHYLTRFPITGLKLDRAFVAGLGERSTARHHRRRGRHRALARPRGRGRGRGDDRAARRGAGARLRARAGLPALAAGGGRRRRRPARGSALAAAARRERRARAASAVRSRGSGARPARGGGPSPRRAGRASRRCW